MLSSVSTGTTQWRAARTCLSNADGRRKEEKPVLEHLHETMLQRHLNMKHL